MSRRKTRSISLRHAWTVLKIVVSVGLLVWLGHRSNWRDALPILRAAPWSIHVLGLAMVLAAQMLVARRLQLLLASQSILLRYVFSLRLTLVGLFVGNFLPSTIGGDAVKVLILVRRGYGKTVPTASVLVDRFVNMVAVIFLVPSAFFVPDLMELLAAVPIYVAVAGTLIGLGLLVIVLYVMRRGTRWHLEPRETRSSLRVRILRLVDRLATISTNWTKKPRILLLALGLSWAAVLSSIMAVWIASKGLGITVSFVELLSVLVLVYFVALLPISLNGLGVQEISVVFLLARLGISSEHALALAVLIRLYYTCASLLGVFEILTWKQGQQASDRVSEEKSRLSGEQNQDSVTL